MTVPVSRPANEVGIEKSLREMLERATLSSRRSLSSIDYFNVQSGLPSRGIDLLLCNRPHRSISSFAAHDALLELAREIHLLLGVVGESMQPANVRFRIGINQTFERDRIAGRMV